mmetsp:Transcript_7195/g.11308  ORF Transcript_7195/g.11308 Transcript_7195/m.11308 type:complete len:205 (+) Transcript_7195:944-1558(+)
MINLLQNSADEKVALSTPSIRKKTANAPLAYPLSSTILSTSTGTFPSFASYPNRDSKTCSESTVAESKESAINPAFVNTRFNGGAKGNSTSLAFLFIFSNCGDMVKMPPFFLSPSSSSLSLASLRNMFSTVSLAFRSVMLYCFNVLRARSGLSMIPMVITSQPTDGCPRRADSDWAVTRDPIHSSDMRSNIIERDVFEVVAVRR